MRRALAALRFGAAIGILLLPSCQTSPPFASDDVRESGGKAPSLPVDYVEPRPLAELFTGEYGVIGGRSSVHGVHMPLREGIAKDDAIRAIVAFLGREPGAPVVDERRAYHETLHCRDWWAFVLADLAGLPPPDIPRGGGPHEEEIAKLLRLVKPSGKGRGAP